MERFNAMSCDIGGRAMLKSLLALVSDAEQLQQHMRELRVVPQVTPAEVRAALSERYGAFERPVRIDDVIAHVQSLLETWSIQVTHPRYFGLFNPSTLPVSVAADALVAAYNPQLAVWWKSPASNEIEQYALQFLLARLGVERGQQWHAAFTTGGNEANHSAVLAALAHHFPSFGDDGAASIGHARMYVSSEGHLSLEKIASNTGIGRNGVRIIPATTTLQMDVDALRATVRRDVAAGDRPFMVVGTAGTTTAGVIDPLRQIAELCREHALWYHVDAAWGGSAALSPVLLPHLAGIELADSITWDAHKWLSVPMAAGMFFCRHPAAVARAFGTRATYVPDPAQETHDNYLTTLQWSRRFIGLKLFMALAELGQDGYREMIEHQTRMGDALRTRLEAGGWRIVNRTPLPLVCFTHPAIESGAITTTEVLRRLYERGRVWISEVKLGDARVLRACITSYLTAEPDLDTLVGELAEVTQSS
jgi:glutamate/tyrosine decarboxylase-like PLP-dependent enzyme